jgi:hypothetical protein
MTLSEFNALTPAQQLHTIRVQGKLIRYNLIESSEDFDILSNIYEVGSFYPEVFYDLKSLQIVGLRCHQTIEIPSLSRKPSAVEGQCGNLWSSLGKVAS